MATTPQQLAIGIRRHFTTPGEHPYDTVEWERRDARIQNFREGGDAFHQPGVEFPASWSQNATNIVAQKYFRGTLGTPEREWSLRQVIDRVADTIAEWGRSDGYFVDDAEAETFRAELKYVLLHQRAAFNSPVWFNIGVPGVPQQASACQPYHAPVVTPGGLVPIGALVEGNAVGTKVHDAHGLTRIVAVKHNGRKPVLRIHTKAGIPLDVTADHLVWKSSGAGSGRFVEAGTLRAGDTLEWHRAESFGHGEFDARDAAEAALAGWLQSDGFVGQYQHGTNRSLTIEAIVVTGAEREWVTAALDVVVPDVHRRESLVRTIDETLDCRRIRLYGEGLRGFVERWGLRERGLAMRVPPQLFTAPLPVVAAYLRSVFQAEGYVSVRANAVVGLDMVAEELVRGLQQLLMRFGIFSRVRRKEDNRPGRKGTWSLSVRVLGDRRTFADEIGFIDSRKAEKLEASFEIDGRGAVPVKRLQIDRVEELGELDVYDIQTESGEYLSNHLRVHNCFILSVDDTMDDILNWYREEGIIFKGGSGAGVNLSKIRSSRELLKGGGTASGPVSFMRGADASAGTIKSGGKTRRAAKMVVLNADHPDIEEFIWCKAIEERKARALREAGFDMDLDGKDSHSIQYQNANNSVRVTDEFMRAVENDEDWHLRAVTTGEILETVRARDLWRQIAESSWECADPGVQFDTTINRWHTAHATGRINASNPCFTADTYVHTDKGLVRFDALVGRVSRGETFGVYTHDATNADAPAERVEVTRPEAIMLTGFNEIVRLRFDNGSELRCTPNHRIWTVNRGYVRADELTADDEIKSLTLPTPAVHADWSISRAVRLEAMRGTRTTDGRSGEYWLPEKWSADLAHYIGWLVGDGCISGNMVSTVYGSDEEQHQVLPRHRALAAAMNPAGASDGPKPSVQANGTLQLRLTRKALARYFTALGVCRSKAAGKTVPSAINGAPSEIVAAFLRGLFDADGCVYDGATTRYVGLGSASQDLLEGVQRLLSTFGIFSRIYATRRAAEASFTYTRSDGTTTEYGAAQLYDLRISSHDIAAFAREIGFSLPSKASKLAQLLATRNFGTARRTVRLVGRTDDGVELTYNLTEPRNHSYIANGTVVANCSEYLHVDNSACNLASINLLTFLDDDGNFDIEGYKQTVEVVFTAQEILVGNADYPTPAIAETSRRFRQLGLGYANLGALLMAEGMPYDSDAGRAWAAVLTAIMTGHAYATSARTAARMGPFAGYAENAQYMNGVLEMHRDAVSQIDAELVPAGLLSAARQAWDEAVGLGTHSGVRNSQATVLAPTGTISFMLDCDTTGIEPDLALTKAKKLVGGGTMFIVNQTVPRALRKLGYSSDEVDAIVRYIDEHKTIVGAPGLDPEHLPVFACSMGDNAIHYMGHVRMMGAVQPSISGAISKTCNLPEEATVDDFEAVHMAAWKLGLKAVALYRDNCKVAQPLATQKKQTADPAAHHAAERQIERIVEHVIVQEPVRQKLPRTRAAKTFSFRVADCHGYVTVGEYGDGRPGELFLQVAKQGSTLAGIMDAFAISVSHGLQYGVPFEAFVRMFTNMRFEPAGMTDDPDIRFATSLVDYIFRRLAVEYLPYDQREAMGILTVGERMQPTLPGVEESATPSSQGLDLGPDDLPPSAALPSPPRPAVREHEVVLCHACGDIMQRAGSCHVCTSCGATSGCS
jgi:ribonucleotide reductase alpha subunit